MRDLNDLYYVVQVVDHRGIAPAARALGMQKSKLSRRRPAGGAIGCARLIQRSSRQFSVTEVGQAYHQHCLAMLVEAEAAQAVIDNVTAEPRGVIRVACAPGLLTYQMGELITRFMALHPEMEVHLHSTSRRVDVIVHAVFPSRRGLLPSVRLLLDFLVAGCDEQHIHNEASRASDQTERMH